MQFPTDQRPLRLQARTRRATLQNRAEFSRRILGAVMALPQYAVADTVLFYVGVRDEVQTVTDLKIALDSHRTIVVPWCEEGRRLQLFQLDSVDDLAIGKYGIPEPAEPLRSHPDRRIAMDQVDLAIVPGVAFDRRGGRIGQGRGYFDRLLSKARSDATLVGVAFECQIFDQIPMQAHDVLMDVVVTEDNIYSGKRQLMPH
ncbi:MAG: 5-formyltetrahydrofolate cyclo-ligase [Planctomycetaceae bacterium]